MRTQRAARPSARSAPHGRRWAAGRIAAALGAAAALCAFALLYDPGLWSAIWNGDLPHSWDGSGHYAAAKLYADSIFPDTFGWLPQYAAGTPFPNFYPPLFQWIIGALTNWLGVPFDAAFKAVLLVCALSMPLAIWRLARTATGRTAIGILAAAAAFLLLFDKRNYHPLGLSYPSTFLIGLYTQPLGFLCTCLWYERFCRARRRPQWLASTLLMALVFLSSMFTAEIAVGLWTTTVGFNWYRALRGRAPRVRKRLRAVAAWQSLTLPIGALLAAFWLVPAFQERAFFVTRPMPAPSSELTNPLLLTWYAVGAAGAVIWARRPSAGTFPVLFTLVLGYIAVSVANQPAFLPWLPVQPSRALSTLNFLVAVPVGVAVSHAARLRRFRWRIGWALAASAVLLLALRPLVETAEYRLAFYSASNGDFRRVAPILRFAEPRHDGMFLVEQAPMSAAGPALDGRALSAYLGMQGNKSASFESRESPLSSPLLYPLAGAFSAGKDTWGLSSMLADDAGFLQEDLETHLRQAREYGIRYLVLVTNAAKARLAKLPADRAVRHDFGVWSVFELAGPPRGEAETMAAKPVLVLTSFSTKLTRRSDYNFLRIAEEEFLDAPGLPLAFGPEYRAEALPDAGLFSGLVVESYRCANMQAAFSEVQRFSRVVPVVLVESDDPLFRLLYGRRAELGQVTIVRRTQSNDDRWIGVGRPVPYRFDAVRQTWIDVKSALLALSAHVHAPPPGPPTDCLVTWLKDGERIECGDGRNPVPVRVATSFHPNWRASEKQPVLMLGPSLIYTTARGSTDLTFQRSAVERAAMFVSALVLFGVLAGMLLVRRPVPLLAAGTLTRSATRAAALLPPQPPSRTDEASSHFPTIPARSRR